MYPLDKVDIGSGFFISEITHHCNEGKLAANDRAGHLQSFSRWGFLITHDDGNWEHNAMVNTCGCHSWTPVRVTTENPLTIAGVLKLGCCGVTGRVAEGRWYFA